MTLSPDTESWRSESEQTTYRSRRFSTLLKRVGDSWEKHFVSLKPEYQSDESVMRSNQPMNGRVSMVNERTNESVHK